ncbi:MAG: hypothetical protein U1C74_11500 [Phenylobacterium sp.]|nr:hypothetical protein [Phenylobacterium sp.]
MGRLNLTALLTGAVLAILILVLMSFENPFRVALAAALLAAMNPVRRLILELAPPTEVSSL